jgi:RNA polymerase sigma factor (sigma-70 family)
MPYVRVWFGQLGVRMEPAAYQRGSAILEPDVPAANQVEFDLLYRDHHGAVQRHLVYLTGNAQLAEDLTQDTFARLYQQGLLEGEALRNPRAWLLTVASNLAYNHFRAESRRLARESGEASPAEPPLRDLDEALDVRAALLLLDPRDRVVLMLRNSGFSYAEIAEAVGLASSSVGTILARSQRRFREAYESAHRADEKE